MKKTLAGLIVATATCGALVLGAGPALAATASTTDDGPSIGSGSSLIAIQRAGAAATAKRIVSLNAAIARVNANTKLTDADRSTILATLTSDLSAMKKLADEIKGDTTATSAYADYHSIFVDYRVYAVALPQSLYAAGADALTGTALPKLNDAYDKLSAALTKHADKSTPALEAELADMKQKIADATSASSGLAADALAVTPAQYDADHTVLADLRGKLRDAVADAKDAAQDGRDIAAALRGSAS